MLSPPSSRRCLHCPALPSDVACLCGHPNHALCCSQICLQVQDLEELSSKASSSNDYRDCSFFHRITNCVFHNITNVTLSFGQVRILAANSKFVPMAGRHTEHQNRLRIALELAHRVRSVLRIGAGFSTAGWARAMSSRGNFIASSGKDRYEFNWATIFLLDEEQKQYKSK